VKTFPFRSQTDSADTPRVDGTPAIGGGTLFHFTDWLAVDVGVGAGKGSASVALLTTFGGARADADFRVFTGSVAARLYLTGRSRVRPWVSVGARGIALRPTGGSVTIDGRATSLDKSLQSTTTTDLSTGAGVSLGITPRVAVEVSGNHGFGSGWSAGAALVFQTGWRRRDWVPPCPRWELPPCWEWGPYGPTLPFAYPAPQIIHNEGLDAILADIQSAAAIPSEHVRTKEDLLKLVDASARRFLHERGLDAAIDAYQAGRENSSRDASLASIPGFDRLGQGQKKSLLEIDRIVVDAGEDQLPHRQLQDVAKKSLRELGPTQSQPVVIAASIASGSLSYWYVRGPAWKDAVARFLGVDPGPAAIHINWKKLGRADLIGAVGGAVGALFTGGVLVGAVGGGLGASAAEALDQIL
jgi:hypothetical protein